MNTENHVKLPESLCFEADGHVTDVVMTCLADGETAIIPAAAAAHVDACDACTTRLGAEALLSVSATDALLASAASQARAPVAMQLRAISNPMAPAVQSMPEPLEAPRRGASSGQLAPSSRRRRPLPIGAIAAALFVAVLGALPGWMDSLRTLREVVPGYLHALPIWSHALEAVARSMMQSRSAAALRWTIAAVFIGMGALLARSMTRKRLLEGDFR
jgi:hypothetical protein